VTEPTSCRQVVCRSRRNIRGGNKLLPAHVATTVRLDAGREPVVTDGPFVEGKEVVSGYTEVDVADLDEALRMVSTARLPSRGDTSTVPHPGHSCRCFSIIRQLKLERRRSCPSAACRSARPSSTRRGGPYACCR